MIWLKSFLTEVSIRQHIIDTLAERRQVKKGYDYSGLMEMEMEMGVEMENEMERVKVVSAQTEGR